MTLLKQLQSKNRRLCRTAIYALSKKHNVKVERKDGRLCIVGEVGFISVRPHGETFERSFIPGHGKPSDWQEYFDRGVCLSWTMTYMFATGDNFDPQDAEEVQNVIKMLNVPRKITTG